MIRNLTVLITLMIILFAVNVTGIGSFYTIGDHAALAFGFILLASYVSGRIARRAKLPMITGYLLAGFFFGPHVLGAVVPELRILTPEILEDLSIFNTIALGLIAFNAGGEMKMESLKSALKSIAAVALGQTVSAGILMVTALMIFGSRFALFADLSTGAILGVSVLFAVIAMANSPSSTIALIVEYKAKGPLTTISLGVTILKDVVVIVAFSLAMILAQLLLGAEGGSHIEIVGLLIWEVAGSIGIGLGLGWLMGKYIKYVGREMPLILLALSFLAMSLANDLHLSGLLLCMSAGFYVENFTDRGGLLIDAIERYSLPIFVLFFTITGAELQLVVLAQVWPMVLLLVGLRTFSIWAGTTAASALAKDPPTVRKNLWLGFLTQAGVSLGLATLIGEEIPGIGVEIETIIVAAVALNQIAGPVAFRFGLLKSGEGKVE
jgi:Kef-type K+ transport system membrane component KefB